MINRIITKKPNTFNFLCEKNEPLKIFIIFIFFYLILFKRNQNLFFSIFKNINTKDKTKSKKELDNIIRIGIYVHSLTNGGVERNTALLLNHLSIIKNYEVYLFYNIKNHNEYRISLNIQRINININSEKNTLKRKLLNKKINIFIYQQYDERIMLMLKSLKKVKIIFYNHSCFLFWLYSHDLTIFSCAYNQYKNSKFVISLVHFENDFVFKKWGIKSIYMNNFMTYEYEKVIQSNLSSKNIIMIGRGNDINKRFDLGIKAMKYITLKIRPPLRYGINFFYKNGIPFILRILFRVE
jgi:hypothetical protein